MSKRFLCVLAVFAVVVSLSAQTILREDFSEYIAGANDDDVYRGNVLSNSGVSWNLIGNLLVSRACYKSRDGSWSCVVANKKAFLVLSYQAGMSIIYADLSNVSSISMRIARTSETYETSDPRDNTVSIRTSSNESDLRDGNGTIVATLSPASFTSVIDGSKAGAIYGQPYNADDFTLFSYRFDTPYTGYIAIQFASSPDDNALVCPYIVIPEITIEQVDAPEPCSSCFTVNF